MTQLTIDQFVPPSYTTDEKVGLSSETGSIIFNKTTNSNDINNLNIAVLYCPFTVSITIWVTEKTKYTNAGGHNVENAIYIILWKKYHL